MPKYFYKCKKCDFLFKIYHSINEKLKDCPECEAIDGLVRKVNKVFVKKQQTTNLDNKVGNLTKQFIEDNKTILKEYKEEIAQNEYDDTNISG